MESNKSGPGKGIAGDRQELQKSTKRRLNMIIIGRTGAGKSTFINMMMNMLSGVDYYQKRVIGVRLRVVLNGPNGEVFNEWLECEQKYSGKQSDSNAKGGIESSQTQGFNTYEIETEDCIYCLADSPGIGDSDGLGRDQEVIQEIVAAFKELGKFHAICLVHKSTDVRLDPFVKYLIAELKGVLTNDCINNFIVCYTCVSNPGKIDAKSALAKLEIPLKNSFYFENDCIIHPESMKKCFGPEEEDNYEAYLNSALDNWKRNLAQTKKMMSALNSFQEKTSSGIVLMNNRKLALHAIIIEESEKIQTQKSTKAELEHTRKAIELAMLNYTKNKDHTVSSEMKLSREESYEVDEAYWVDEYLPDGKFATRCRKCKSACHNPCGLETMYSSDGDLQLKNCAAFNGASTCNTCHCLLDHHSHSYLLPTKKIRKATKTREVEERKMVANTDDAKKLLFERAEIDMKRLNRKNTELIAQNKALDIQIQSCYRKIAYLNKQISSQSFQKNTVNEYLLDAIKAQIEGVKKSDLPHDEKTQMEESLKEDMKCYIQIKEAIDLATKKNGGEDFLTAFEQREINEMITKIENEMKETFLRCRSANRGDNKRKSIYGAVVSSIKKAFN